MVLCWRMFPERRPMKAKGFLEEWLQHDSPVPLILVDRDPCHTSPVI
jgi:hypothetical protein